ncbi:LacI family transcriptional regulator [Rhodoferax sp. OV413]|uniref:LacI family DNA-binding transcriptional regulator n=1 Tax=Rhodoferax sp. OV413 TaxID=1855285 RepID=UPI0008900B3D|nr:LacI family DNA-binding transcriptional regulator [Rhodoferax sp. OV413]SDP38942.1 LacI family transcriptional regulator [Rhodoferax sp. OV413]
MAHPHLLKDIASQAGTSLATVDRVLNQRGGVRQHTVRRVEQALQELERQKSQVGLVGRKFLVDLVMQTPERFSRLVRNALEQAMPGLHPAIFRARYHLAEDLPVAQLVATLDKIAQQGSHGVLLKAPDVPEVVQAVARLQHKGIPVVTLVTDVPGSARRAYVGMDNRAAGHTAAYLVAQWLGPATQAPAGVLISISSNHFRGEEEREIGFRQAIRDRYPHIAVHEVSEGLGLHEATVGLVRQRLRLCPEVQAVYSIGGANAAILEAFAQLQRPCRVFIAHDLDADNLPLLRAGRLQAVLHHDLQHDMRQACFQLMAAHGAAPAGLPLPVSSVQVVTPFNLPQHSL